MSFPRILLLSLRSLLAMLLACAAVVLVNLLGSEIASWIGLPPGGEGRLAWDLGWVIVAGVAGAWAIVRFAPAAHRAHASAFFVVALVLDGFAVAKLGDDYPLWFTAGLLGSLPFQVGAGAWCGLRAVRRAH